MAVCNVSYRVQKENVCSHPDLHVEFWMYIRILDVYSLLTAIAPTILDVLDVFCVHLGVNRNLVVCLSVCLRQSVCIHSFWPFL